MKIVCTRKRWLKIRTCITFFFFSQGSVKRKMRESTIGILRLEAVFQKREREILNVWHIDIWLDQALLCCRKVCIIFQLQSKKMSPGGKFWNLVVIYFIRVEIQKISRINGGRCWPKSLRQLREDWLNCLVHQMTKVILLFHSLVDHYILFFETCFGTGGSKGWKIVAHVPFKICVMFV